MSRPGLFSALDVPTVEEIEAVEPEREETSLSRHTDTAKEISGIFKRDVRAPKARPLTEVLDNELKKAPIDEALLRGDAKPGADAKPRRRRPKPATEPPMGLSGVDGARLDLTVTTARPPAKVPLLDAADAAPPKIRLPQLPQTTL